MMNSRPKISVIIPCYNMGDYVVEAINSVFAYPKQDEIEIIVINDGSDDNGYTKSVLDTFTQSNVRVIHQENTGLGNARNLGIKASNAPYVLLLDADNKIRNNYIGYGISILDSHPDIAAVYGDLYRFGVEKGEVRVGDFDSSKLINKNYIDACLVMRKSAWASVNGYDEHMPVMGYEDWDLNLRLFFKGWAFKYINEVCYDYRVRDNSMILNSNQNRDVLLKYMFSKPELKQAALLREKLLECDSCKKELESIKNRKLMRIALKVEKLIKKGIGMKK